MFKNAIDTKIDEQIMTILEALNTCKSPVEYAEWSDQLVKLYKLREETSISNETWATIAANLAGILLVLNFERANVIASKSFGFIRKLF